MEAMIDDREAMEAALDEARRAAEADEVPIGAVVVREGVIIARGQNRVLRDVRRSDDSCASGPPGLCRS